MGKQLGSLGRLIGRAPIAVHILLHRNVRLCYYMFDVNTTATLQKRTPHISL